MSHFTNHPRTNEWVVLCRRQDLLNKTSEYLHKNCKLCADHFEDCMLSNDKKDRLKNDAKPTLFDIPNPPAKVGQKRRVIQKEITIHGQGNYAIKNVNAHSIRLLNCH